MKQIGQFFSLKAWAKALAIGCFALLPIAAEAGFTKTMNLSGGRKTLENGTIYILTDNEDTVTASSGFSAYKVNDNATAVLYIPSGKKLTLKGGAASGTSGAGAGIEVPASSTLIVVGGGTLEVFGGKGGGGTSGNGGGSGQYDRDDDEAIGGKGGNGGVGGGGAGAGIGTRGGVGGVAGEQTTYPSWTELDWGDFDTTGADGGRGGNGGSSSGMGTVYILGTVKVSAKAGETGTGGAAVRKKSSGEFAFAVPVLLAAAGYLAEQLLRQGA